MIIGMHSFTVSEQRYSKALLDTPEIRFYFTFQSDQWDHWFVGISGLHR
jgi:hypothetical protein